MKTPHYNYDIVSGNLLLGVIDLNICILEKPGRCLDQMLEWLSERNISDLYVFENEVRFLEQVRIMDPDVCIIQVENSKIHGLRVSEIVKQMSPHTRIILLSETGNYALEAFEVGVQGYLVCPFEKSKFIKTILWNK